jgi:SAM-dependent methyltransferase
MEGVPARSFRAILSDSEPLPLPDGLATVVVATEVVEHVRNPRAFMAELARIGAPGARYLISVPHPTSEAVLRQIAPPWYIQEPFHINVFSPDELDGLITEVGLAVEGRYENGFYWSMHWFLRMAIGMADPWEECPPHPALEAWDAVAAELGKLACNPRGGQLILHLDHLVPKSQVRLARKSISLPATPLEPLPNSSRLKRWFRDGGVHLRGYDLRWSIRRTAIHRQ